MHAYAVSELSTLKITALLLFLDLQAQPSFANTNIVSDLSESSGPVEQLKSKFFGPQVAHTCPL